MRIQLAAINSGIGRRVAWTGALGSLLVVLLAIGLVSRHGVRHERDQKRQQVGVIAAQGARAVGSRIEAAETVLRAVADNLPEGLVSRDGLRRQLTQSGPFSWGAIADPLDAVLLEDSQRRLLLSPEQQIALESGRSIVLRGVSPAGIRIYVARRVSPPLENRVLVAEIAPDWLWSPLQGAVGENGLLVVGRDGGAVFGRIDSQTDFQSMFRERLRTAPVGAPSLPLTWQSGGVAWSAALSVVTTPPGSLVEPLGVIAAQPDRHWGVFLFEAARQLLPMAMVMLLLVALSAVLMAQRYVPTLRALRRGLLQLAEQRSVLPRPVGEFHELRQVVDAFNRTAERVERQRTTLRALTEIDSLLIGAGDVENVLDEVLSHIREVTLARNVGVTLVDSNATDHGRLFSVGAEGGCPVARVSLDPLMAQTLTESRAGLTIMRCEEQRHSFLVPMQAGGAQFFWVWPVMVGDRLAAILAVGYGEPPQHGRQVAHYGTECARRLAASLATSARSEQLYRQAHFDPLTQLPNRLLFRDRLAQELTGLSESATRGALLFIDLDHFKRVNDSLGHEAGDQLLAIVAQRLRACVKDGDTVARLGGDEFTVLLRQVVEPGAVAAVAERIIQSLQMPVSIGGKDHQVRASIGITLFPDDGATLDDLLRNADLAMYRAKDMGRGTAVFYEPKMATRGTRVADSGLYRALKRREFSLFYQPQYSIHDGSLVAMEALLRWQTPRDGLRTPADFIPAAEESGLIVDLGGWVLEAACQQLTQWRNAQLDAPRLSINLSPQQLRDPALVSGVKRMMERYRIGKDELEFELTEAALIDSETQSSINGLAALGVGLILDDFGTGHAALNNLRRYPVRAVKIDRTFIEDVAVNASAAALAGTIIVMAHALDKQVVAEGVETVDQLDFLRDRGCDVAQGYYLAQPLTAAAMTEMLVHRAGAKAPEAQVARA